MNVIIIGASGMVGGLILNKCLASFEVTQVTSIVRKPTQVSHTKLKEIVHTDFLDFSAIEEEFKHQDVCFYCIGVYTGQVSRTEFAKITIDYTRAFAEMLRKHNEKTTFCFLSGQGADRTEKSRVLFAKDKGIAENILFNLKFAKMHTFRPGYIYPVEPRREPNLTYKLMRLLYKPLLRWLFPFACVTSEQLTSVMVEVGLHGGHKEQYENNDIRKIQIIP
ncbi:NAD(P)H-binding protein [Flavobacterium phycosphaerae]|uniref:NAD(P)H-binding protein n=1 Tax=Flavobacterium phycosphaerae TaxID=2697515 RepID=UPI00138AE5C7|nr:NAD(P)H-binding protein [Flavobacterium phycosphaerae]